jgi:hypothetical protein
MAISLWPHPDNQGTKNLRTRHQKQKDTKIKPRVPLCPLRLPTCISAGRCVRHRLTILRGTPAAELTGVVPVSEPVQARAQTDAPRAAVAARTADEPPQAVCIDVPAADFPAACTAAQVVTATAHH